MSYTEEANPELAALGWMVSNPSAFERFSESITAEVFSYRPARTIFEVFSEQWHLHQELPNMSESQWLIKREAAKKNIAVGVLAQTLQDLGEIFQGAWTASSGEIMRRIVAESIVRDISEDLDGKPGEYILAEMDAVKRRIESLDQSTHMEDQLGIFPFSLDALDNPDSFIQNLYKGSPVPTGLGRLDLDLGGGVSPGEVAMVMAPPNTGKSMFLLNVGFFAALQGYRVVYYALDNLDADMVTRLWTLASQKIFNRKDPAALAIAVKAKVNVEKLQSRFILKKLPTQKATIRTLERHVDNIARAYRDEDLADGRDAEVAGYPHLCIIDYPAKLACHERLATDKRTALTYIYQGIVSLAETKHMATWVASQVNRSGWEESFQKSYNISDASTKMEEVCHAFGLGRSPTDVILGQGFLTCHKARRPGLKHKIYPLLFDDARASIVDNREVDASWESGTDGRSMLSGGDGYGGSGGNGNNNRTSRQDKIKSTFKKRRTTRDGVGDE